MRNSGLASLPDRGIGADRELLRLSAHEKINSRLDDTINQAGQPAIRQAVNHQINQALSAPPLFTGETRIDAAVQRIESADIMFGIWRSQAPAELHQLFVTVGMDGGDFRTSLHGLDLRLDNGKKAGAEPRADPGAGEAVQARMRESYENMIIDHAGY